MMTNEIQIDTDVSNLSSAKLGYIIRISGIKNVMVDKDFIEEITKELMSRGDYESELARRAPH